MTLAGAALVLLFAQAGQPAPFIGEFAVEDAAATVLGPGSSVTLTVVPGEGAAPSPELGRRFKVRQGADGTLQLDLAGYPVAPDAAVAAHREASFMIDFDEAPVQALHAKFKATGKPSTIEELTAFVDASIPKKNLKRSFDPASVVARRGEGDCTEHAVLLAAMARSFGIPARVVLGVALVETPKGAGAFGHAWVEVAQEKTWRVADAALRGFLQVQYLPLAVMEDESPSFLGATVRQGGIMAIQKIRVEDPAKR